MAELKMVVREAWVPGQPEAVLRPEAVEKAMEELRAMGLSLDEEQAVIGGLQAKMMVATQTTVVVTATSLASGSNVTSVRTVAVSSAAPNLVAHAVAAMVEQASPVLWSEILGVLEAQPVPEKAHGS